MNLFLNKRLACALALFLTAAVCGADGQEQSFAEANCAFTPPAGWHQKEIKDQPGFVAAYGDPGETRTLLILVYGRGKAQHVFNEDSVAEFDKGMEKAGSGPKTSGKFVQFAGFPTYERRGQPT